MPRLVVVLAALCIFGAGAYGGLRGFQFTDLDTAPPAVMPVEVAAKSAAELPPPAPAVDEFAVREMARSEVRSLIRARPAPVVAEVQIAPAPETPSAEPVEEPTAAPVQDEG